MIDIQVLSLPSQSCVAKVKITEMSTVAVATVIPVKGMIQSVQVLPLHLVFCYVYIIALLFRVLYPCQSSAALCTSRYFTDDTRSFSIM